MLKSWSFAPAAVAGLFSFWALGCGTDSNSEPPSYYGSPDAGEAGEDASGGEDVATPDVGQPDSPAIDVQPQDGSGPEGKTILYAHNKTTLFSVDPEDPNLSVKTVGIFDCVGEEGQPASMTDLAVDRDGKLYGVASKAVFLDMEIDEANNVVHCSAQKVDIDETQGRFYGLTFAPPTAKLGTSETLIAGNTVGELYRIDTTSGELTIVGKFGNVPSNDGVGHDYPEDNVGQAWALSGDMVFLENEGSPVGFATLRDCPDPTQAPSGCSTIDTLVEIDVSRLEPITSGAVPFVTRSIRGQILPPGCSDDTCGFGSMYGIAAFNDKVYGFAYSGQLVEIDNDKGEAQLISTPLSGDGFAGAGVTTLAPVIAPPPK